VLWSSPTGRAAKLDEALRPVGEMMREMEGGWVHWPLSQTEPDHLPSAGGLCRIM
jgi:hypothetical protein